MVTMRALRSGRRASQASTSCCMERSGGEPSVGGGAAEGGRCCQRSRAARIWLRERAPMAWMARRSVSERAARASTVSPRPRLPWQASGYTNETPVGLLSPLNTVISGDTRHGGKQPRSSAEDSKRTSPQGFVSVARGLPREGGAACATYACCTDDCGIHPRTVCSGPAGRHVDSLGHMPYHGIELRSLVAARNGSDGLRCPRAACGGQGARLRVGVRLGQVVTRAQSARPHGKVKEHKAWNGSSVSFV